MDVGQLCFSIIEKGVRRRGKAYRVATDSFCLSRSALVRQIVSYLADRFDRKDFRPLTDATHARRAVEFSRWCFEGKHANVLVSKENAERALFDYANHLRERIRRGTLNPNTAGPMLSDSKTFCRDFLQEPDLARRMRPIDKGLRFANATEVPDEIAVSRVLALSWALFTSLSDLALDFRPFPHAIRMPEYLNFAEDILWYFPGKKPFMTAKDRLHATVSDQRRKFRPFDFEKGKVFEPAEIVHQYPKLPKKLNGIQSLDLTTATRSVEIARENIARANSNSVDIYRLEAAMKAHNAFLILFAADTGMNATVIDNCPFTEDFTVNEGRPNFRTIKFRAAKEISFELSTKLLPHFKRFIQLRRYLLEDRVCETLFFTFGLDLSQNRTPGRMGLKLLYRAYDILERIDPALQSIHTRQWRISSIDFFIRNTDTRTAAAIAQNSETTIKLHYASGSETTAAAELTNFFDKIQLRITGDMHNSSTGKLAGCSEPGVPQAIDDSNNDKPDCRQPTGCLFCAKFIVHSDEIDLRKLLSCKYLINVCLPFSNNYESFQAQFGEIITRIDVIVNQIRNLTAEMQLLTSRVEFEVERDQILDPHFQHRLTQMIALGMLPNLLDRN